MPQYPRKKIKKKLASKAKEKKKKDQNNSANNMLQTSCAIPTRCFRFLAIKKKSLH